jgi:hypothetical protein
VQPAGQRDDLGDRQLDDAAGVGVGRVEDRDAALRGGPQVDLVGADAERADRQQVGGGVEDLLRDVRRRADAEQVDALHGLDELVLAQRPVAGLDLEALAPQEVGAVDVDVLQQQDADVLVREQRGRERVGGRHGHHHLGCLQVSGTRLTGAQANGPDVLSLQSLPGGVHLNASRDLPPV